MPATYSINYRGLQDVCASKSGSHTLCYHSFVAYCKTGRSLLGPLATESPCILFQSRSTCDRNTSIGAIGLREWGCEPIKSF